MKYGVIVLLTLLGSGLGFSAACADQGDTGSFESSTAGKMAIAPIKSPKEMEAASLKMRLRDLERKVSDMERENRFRDDRIRQLNQYVDDLQNERRNY